MSRLHMSVLTIPFHSGRIVVLADLHYDSYVRQQFDPFEEHGLDPLHWQGVDALILAGDIADQPHRNWPRAFKYLRRFIAPDRTYVFSGNHDFYGHALDAESDLCRLAEAAGVHFVQKTELRHGRTRFLCATLWTDFDLFGDPESAMRAAGRGMRDYRDICKLAPVEPVTPDDLKPRPRYVPIVPADTLAVHWDHRHWLQHNLGQPHFAGQDGRTVVVTHHCPARATAGPLTDLSPAFHSDLSGLIAEFKPDIWAFGHSHRRLRATVADCDVRNVSLGYPFEPAALTDCDILDTCFVDSNPWADGS